MSTSSANTGSLPKLLRVLLDSNEDVVRFVTGIFENAKELPTSIMITKLRKLEGSFAATVIIESSDVIETPKPSIVLPST
jgi:hypothetical protein